MKIKYEISCAAGVQFGKYTVISDTIDRTDRKHYHPKVLCKCECGSENLISCDSLINGTSSGCLRCNGKRFGDKNALWKGYKNINGSYLGRIKHRANVYGLEYDLDGEYLNQLLEMQNFRCALSNSVISMDDKTASLDRISSDGGYTKGNVQWVHKDVNLMKNHFDQDYFIKMCKKIAELNT